MAVSFIFFRALLFDKMKVIEKYKIGKSFLISQSFVTFIPIQIFKYEEDSMKYDSVQKFNSVENYILQMRPILRKRALFSDGTSDYRIPPEPKAGETVKIRFRTAADNVDLVLLCHEDEKIEMRPVDRERDFDYYEAEIRVGEEQYKYHFEIVS